MLKAAEVLSKQDSGMENLDARAIAALWSPSLRVSLVNHVCGPFCAILCTWMHLDPGAGATVPGGKEREGYALIGIKGSRPLRPLKCSSNAPRRILDM